VEAFAVLIGRKMAEIVKANAKRKGPVDPNNPKERTGNGHPNERVDLDGLDDWAGDGHPKTRPT
jgi:hypothetical protein